MARNRYLPEGPSIVTSSEKTGIARGGSGLPFGSAILIVIGSVEDAQVARTDHLQADGILARGEHVFVGQHGFESRLLSAIDLHRLDEQAPSQRSEGVEHRVDRAGLQLAERGREPLAGQDRVVGAGQTVARRCLDWRGWH